MNKDKIRLLAIWVRDNMNKDKKNLIEFLQEKICKYSNEEKTPSEQIKGMNRLLRDIIKLPNDVFEAE